LDGGNYKGGFFVSDFDEPHGYMFSHEQNWGSDFWLMKPLDTFRDGKLITLSACEVTGTGTQL
jgi:hypothetical protein